MNKLQKIFCEIKKSFKALKNFRSNDKIIKELKELEFFIEESSIISKADKHGKITYVNKKFEDVSGWKLHEVLGKDHKILNSGFHSKEMWANMYKAVIKDKKIWNEICVNKSKDGSIYYVDTYIKGYFDEEGNFTGFMSIRQDVTDIIKTKIELEKKNTYLEHAAKILRHDMHSGINLYIPRGVTSLERRLKVSDIEKLKLESPLKMIKEGLKHSQKVYKGVYEFTNLVKKDVTLSKTMCNIKEILKDYLSLTAYSSQVILDDSLPTINVNESLFCTAIDNLIRNGLKYNDSDTKFVKVYCELPNEIIIEDNGRGLSQEDFIQFSKPYTRKENQNESGSGLGLNISIAILEEHGFNITSEKLKNGTKITIKIKK